MSIMIKKNKENYLDNIPERNRTIQWKEEEEIVVLHLVHTGIYSTLAQKFFHTPKESDVQLDRYGSFVWKQIDGKLSIFAIGEKVKAEFGAEAEPIYARLSKFFYILKEEKYIFFKKKVSGKK